MSDRVGELLVQKNLLSPEQLDRAREEAQLTGTRVGLQLTKLGFIDEDELADAISSQYGVPTRQSLFDRPRLRPDSVRDFGPFSVHVTRDDLLTPTVVV